MRGVFNSAFVVCSMAFAAVWAVDSVHAASVLFDATKHEMAGNADWVIDADAWNLNMPAYPCSANTNEANPQRFPTPPASGVTASTAETYWTGAISSFAIELVKAGHTVETLPDGAAITFGNSGNPQDLSHYKLFIVTEPQAPFSAAEKSAILAFVQAGGGLFMIGDHETSDRDCDGWDAPHVWNDLTGATSATATGLFGIWMRVNGVDDQGSEDWFDDGTDSNVSTDAADPIIHGPFGDGSGGLGLFGSTSMELNPADNPTAQAHVWRTGQAHDTHRVTFATASYGSGRVAAIGDSSPADDGTGDSGDTLHPGWDKAAGGVKNREIHLNACAWLINAAPDTTPPSIVAGPTVAAGDCSATVSWTTDEPATSTAVYGPTTGYGSSSMVPGLVTSHAVTLAGLTPASPYHAKASSQDAAGNGPTESGDIPFTTTAATPPLIVSGPQAGSITGNAATISWTTDEDSSSAVEYGTTASYGSSVSTSGNTTAHAVTLSGLSPTTEYHARVLSQDACGNGPTSSSDTTFTTGAASIDVSGWSIRQYNSALTYVIPAGTVIPSGGYLVIARDSTRAQFQTVFPGMPAATVFLDSNAQGSCANGCLPQINGGESFELYDDHGVKRDGATITISSGNAYQRVTPASPAGTAGSWTVVAQASANPGSGAGAGSAAGVVLDELADASDYTKEFVELYYDAGIAAPDGTPPAAIVDLAASASSSSVVHLTWTATGNDGAVGTASSYDLRMSLSPIGSDAAFTGATRLTGLPAPKAAGQAESFNVAGLSPLTTYHFALKAIDAAANASPLGNDASATTTSAVSHLVVSQIRVSGSTDDVIELYNPTNAAISLSGYSVQYLAANGNFGFRFNLSAGGSVPARGWYLVAGSGYSGTPARDESMGNDNMSGTAGHALLAQKTTNVTGCTDAAIVDKVGYGATASCPEGGSGHNATQPTGGQSVTRKPGGCAGSGIDSDLNDADFGSPAAPVFHDAASTPATPVPTAINDGPICEGGALHLEASAISGATYAWTGPNGFTSTDRTPTILSAPAAAAGTYTVTVNGCTQGTTTAVIIASGAACDDGTLCTTGDVCAGGVCSGAPVACNASDQCHIAGTCDAATGACSNPVAPNGSQCDDGLRCTTDDACSGGACSGSPVACTALDPCHLAGTCDPATGACSNPAAPNGAACDDGTPCTTGDVCSGGVCSGSPVTCSALDQCHVAGTCDPATGACSNPAAPNGAACNDGRLCTTDDVCSGGVCGGTPVVCSALDQCHRAGTCNTSTGACSNPVAFDGTLCNDNNACTQTDTCQSGVCVGAGPVGGPADVGNVTPSKSGVTAQYAWDAVPAASGYDVLRGLLTDGPVGSDLASETCLGDNLADPSASDASVPVSGRGFWYVMRAVSACGTGSYGNAGSGGVAGAPRASATCP